MEHFGLKNLHVAWKPANIFIQNSVFFEKSHVTRRFVFLLTDASSIYNLNDNLPDHHKMLVQRWIISLQMHE